MQAHIDAHLAGGLQGDVPDAWFRAQGRQGCQVCGLSVSTRHGVHPTCRPQARAAAGQDGAVRRDDPLQALPSIAEIQAGRTPTLRHVPAAARSLWCKVLTKALAAVVRYNDLCSWQELLLLPQCVLNAPPRGGRKHAKAAAAYTLDRLRRWEDGDRILLWESRGRTSSKHRSLTTPERKDLATSLAREGFEGKACAALLADGLAPETAATVAALRALHPVQPDPVAPPLHELPPSPELMPDAVAKALQSFPSATAPGPSGLRVQHLREACWPGGRDGLLVQLAGVVKLLASGRACSDAAPLFGWCQLGCHPQATGWRPPHCHWGGFAAADRQVLAGCGRMLGEPSSQHRSGWLCLPALRQLFTALVHGMSAMQGLSTKCWSSWTSKRFQHSVPPRGAQRHLRPISGSGSMGAMVLWWVHYFAVWLHCPSLGGRGPAG